MMLGEDTQAQGDAGGILGGFLPCHHGPSSSSTDATCAEVLLGTPMLTDIMTAELGISQEGHG